MSPIPKEQVLAAYERAPQPVREAFNSEVTTNIILDMKSKYRLHVDTAGVFGQEVGYLLLGLRSPAEFFGTLMLSGTDEQTTRSIMEEVNERIFIPLKRQMADAPASPVPAGSYAQAPEPAPVREAPVPAPFLEYAPAPTLPGSPEPVPAPAAPPPAAVPQSVQASAPAAAVPVEAAWQPQPSVQSPAPVLPATPIIKDYATDPYREPI